MRNTCVVLLFLIIVVPAYTVYAQEPILMDGWPVLLHEGALLASPRQGITIYDIYGDGYLELFLSRGEKIHAYDYIGNPLTGWPHINDDPNNEFCNSPVIGDIDGDNEPEMVCDWSNVSERTAGLIALNTDGSMCQGFPIDLCGNETSRQLILYDLDGDNVLEVIIGVNRFYPDTLFQLRIYTGNGVFYPGWPVEGIGTKGLAAGDIDNDGEPELVINSFSSLLYAMESDGSIVSGFPVLVGQPEDSARIIDQPVLFDITNDGMLEIALLYGIPASTPGMTWGNAAIYDSQGRKLEPWPYYYGASSNAGLSVCKDFSNGQHYLAFGASYDGQFLLLSADDGNLVNGWPFYTPNPACANWDQPSIADIDGDGILDYIFNRDVQGSDLGAKQRRRIIRAFSTMGIWNYFPGRRFIGRYRQRRHSGNCFSNDLFNRGKAHREDLCFQTRRDPL
jgi:hypothetical protein